MKKLIHLIIWNVVLLLAISGMANALNCILIGGTISLSLSLGGMLFGYLLSGSTSDPTLTLDQTSTGKDLSCKFGGTEKVYIGKQAAGDQDPNAGTIRINSSDAAVRWLELTHYQYGGCVRQSGTSAGIFEFWVGSDPDGNAPNVSIRNNGSGKGAIFQARDYADTFGIGVNYEKRYIPRIMILQSGSDYTKLLLENSAVNGWVAIAAKGASNLVETVAVKAGTANIIDPTVVGSECLTNGDLTGGTSWSTTGSCSLNTDRLYFAVGTVKQASGDLAIAGVGGRMYAFTYEAVYLGSANHTAFITTSFAETPVYLDLHDSATTKTVYFKSAASPGDFTIQCTAGEGYLDTFSLKQITGGDLQVCGKVKLPNLATYANNAAALAGGLTAGDLYRTNGDPDTVCVVH